MCSRVAGVRPFYEEICRKVCSTIFFKVYWEFWLFRCFSGIKVQTWMSTAVFWVTSIEYYNLGGVYWLLGYVLCLIWTFCYPKLLSPMVKLFKFLLKHITSKSLVVSKYCKDYSSLSHIVQKYLNLQAQGCTILLMIL